MANITPQVNVSPNEENKYVTDPALLKQLNSVGPTPSDASQYVTDPELLQQLNSPTETFEGKAQKPGDTFVADVIKNYAVKPAENLVTKYDESAKHPYITSAATGVINAQNVVTYNNLASLMELMEADKKKFGPNFENANPEQLKLINERKQAIQDNLNTISQRAEDINAIQEKYAKEVPTLSKKLDALESTPKYQDASKFQQLKMYGKELVNNASDIPEYMAHVSLESLPTSMAQIATAALTFATTGNIRASAMAAGYTSAFTEFGQEYVNLRQQGLNHEEATKQAGIKSGVIGFFDSKSFGSASEIVDNVMKHAEKGVAKRIAGTAKEVTKEVGKQAAFGASGELFGSLASGQPVNVRGVAEEAIGEVAGAPFEALSTYRSKSKQAKQEQDIQDIKDKLAGTTGETPEPTPKPPAEATTPPTETPQPNVVTQDQLLNHATTRLQELEIKANGLPAKETVDENGNNITIPAQPAQPMTEQEVAELKFLQEHQNNPDKLAEGYGVTIGEVKPKGSQDVKGMLGELEGQTISVPPIYQPPVETKPVETKPAEPEKPAETETLPEEEKPPTVIKEPPAVQPIGKVLDKDGKEHELTTIGEASKAGFEFTPINQDKPMYASTDLDGVNSMIRNLFEDKDTKSSTAPSKYIVTSDKNKAIPKNLKKNQVSVEFRPDTLSGNKISGNDYIAYDTSLKAIESFTVHNPTNRYRIAPEVRKFFDIGFNEDGSVTYTLKRVKSEAELTAEKEALSQKYLAHMNAPRGKLKYNYQRLRTPGLNTFQKAIEKYTKLGDALKAILPEIEKIAKEGWYGNVDESAMPFTMELKNKEQAEMYVDIIKHLLKIEPVMKTNLFMDPNVIGSTKRTVPGFYNRVTNNLAMFANGYLDTFIHEAIHAATVHYIEMHPNDPKVKKLEKILEASRKHDRKTRKGEDMLYGNTNLKEFIAEVFSSPEFIQHLSSMDPIFDKTESTSVFDNVKSIIRNMLKAMGVNVEKNRTALDEVMDLSSELFTGKTFEGYIYDKKRPAKEDEASRKQIESPEFKKWFGNSKVVNPDGTPRVMYHGTQQDINEFKSQFQLNKEKYPLHGRYNTFGLGGIYFTPDPNYANMYAKTDFRKKQQSNVVPVYLRMEKPYIYPSGIWADIKEKLFNPIDTFRYKKAMEKNIREKGFPDAENIKSMQTHKLGYMFARINEINALKAKGYDGIISPDGKMFIVFDGNQVKSAVGNKGTYSTESNIITESMRPDYESVEPESGSRVQTKPGANTAILADILGQQMYSTDIGRVSVKEMLQNSFDAIKSMLDSEKIKHGKIDINTNETNRTISVKDNGHGMTQDTLGNTFVTIAGSLKESEISSGSFGVAKLAFLFDAENIHVATMRDGKISVLNTNGKQLKDSLSDPSLAPYTDSYTPEEYGLDKVKKDFPDGHGTITTIQIPETYVNKNGEKESISFPKYVNNHYSLTWSPLRDNIDVTFNGNKVDDVGSDFKKNDYETIANIKYPWGHVHVFASKEKQDHIDTSSNVTVLSDGLYQFLDKIPVNWGETGIEAKSIKRNIYFDVVPSIRANEPGYPFSLDREGFTSKAKKDLEKIKQFIWSKYRLMELKDTSSEFGDFHYVIKKGNKITTKQPNKLTTNKKEDTSNPLNVSANLESKNGKLAPNTNKVPTIDAKTLDDIDIDIDQFKVNQDQIDPNATLIHNNLLVRQNEYTLLSNERDRLQEKMDKDQAMLDQMPKYFPDTFDETPEHKALRESIDKQYEEIEKLSNKMWDTPASSTWKPIDVLGREKFGERFDRCMYDIGDIFRAIRDRVVILAHKGDLPNGESYAPLQKYAVGISFDQEYLGVNVKLPFNGVYVNPIFSDFKDNYRTKAMGLFGTMIHELAHFQVSGHGAQFPKEMQRITAALEADENFDINDLRQELIAIYKKNDDILTYLNTLGENKNDTKPVGIRFQDEQYERRTTSTIGDLAQTGAEGKARQIISRDVEQRDRDAQQMRQPQPVSPEAQTDEEIIYQEEQATRQIFNYRGNPVSINEWEIPEQGRIAATLSKWFQYFADEDAVLTRIMKTLRSLNRSISEMSDIEKKQELKNSRISAQLMVFANEEVRPIVREMLEKGVSLEEINKYLLAKHAPAYNDRMNNINHKVDRNGNIVPYALQDRASSMNTQDAINYINSLDPQRKQILENIAKKWYAIRDKTQRILVESGQETQETIDLWNETYPFYVPLNREQEQQAVPLGLRTGAGVDVRGDFSKRAMGSEKQVVSIVDALLYQRERAVARTENSKVVESIYRLFLEHPNPDFAISVNPDAIYDRDVLIQELENMGYTNAADIADNIMAEPKERYLRKVKPSDFVIDPTTGLAIPNTKEVVDARISRNARFGDNVLTFKVNGRERYVFFSKKDPNAIVMVRTLKNLDAQQLGKFLRANRFITHYMGQIYTVLNPIFAIVNGFKDYPFGMVNLSTTPIRGKQLQVSAKIMPAMLGIMSVLRKERTGGGYSPSIYKWQRIYNEALDAGFQTSNRYAILNTGEDQTYIAQLLDEFKDNNAKQAFRYVINMTYDFASMIENGVRLAAYQQMRESGYSPQESASVAKNLTINFDKKGSRTTVLRTLYLFFNASIRGTVRLGQTLAGPSGGRIIAGGILLGVMQAMMIAAAGFKGDDPPEYIRERNLIIPTGDGKYITIPMPYGLNILPNTGRILTEASIDIAKHPRLKDAHIGKHALNWTNAFFSAFSPFGNQGLSANALIPTAWEAPLAISEHGTNTNAFGQTISRKDSYTRPTPGYMRTKESGTEWGKEFARWMNKMSGGTDYTKGGWSPTGDDIDFLASTYAGPVLGSIAKTVKYAKAKLAGEEVPAYQVPVLGRFQGEIDTKPVITSRFYTNLNAMYEHELTLKNIRNNMEAKRKYLEENPDARLWRRAESFGSEIDNLNAMKKKLEMAKRPQEQIQRLENKKIILMNRFNDMVEKVKNQ